MNVCFFVVVELELNKPKRVMQAVKLPVLVLRPVALLELLLTTLMFAALVLLEQLLGAAASVDCLEKY